MHRILIAEDDKHQRTLYKRELEEEGYEIVVVSTGEEAVKRIRKEDFDLVILDVRMPKMDGLEALCRILDKRRDIPSIIHTAYSSYKDSFMSWAADAYVVKSSNLDELKATVKRLIGKRG